MNYKLMYICLPYSYFIEDFVSKNEGVIFDSYESMLTKFKETGFGWVVNFCKYLNLIGNEACEIFPGFRGLQEKWAAEKNITFDPNNWLTDILFQQIEFCKPDIIYLSELYLFNKEIRDAIRSRFPEIKIIGWRFAKTADYSEFNDLDLLLTGNGEWVDNFRAAGAKVHCVPIGFDPDVLPYVHSIIPKHKFSFIGSVASNINDFSQRFSDIEFLMKKTPLEIWTNKDDFNKDRSFSTVDNLAFQIHNLVSSKNISKSNLPGIKRGRYIRDLKSVSDFYNKYESRIVDSVYGFEANDVIANSNIVFNKHIDCAIRDAGNVRMFETTGLGSCLLTDWKENISDFFEPDFEVLTYKSIIEAVEKFNYLLEHEKERATIAQNGQKRTLKSHNLKVRTELLDYYIQKEVLNSA